MLGSLRSRPRRAACLSGSALGLDVGVERTRLPPHSWESGGLDTETRPVSLPVLFQGTVLFHKCVLFCQHIVIGVLL